MNAGWWNGHLLWMNGGVTPTRHLQDETGMGAPPRQHAVENLGDPSVHVYRGTVRMPREYGVVVRVSPDPYTKAGADSERNDWETWHETTGGSREFKRLTESGNTYVLDAVANDPQWSRVGGHLYEVTQTYAAVNPYWRGATEQSAVATFADAAAVALSVANTGTQEAWLRFVIAGPVTTPKIALSASVWLAFDLDLAVGDVLAIDCKPPISVWYTPSGGNAARAYGYRKAGTDLLNMKAATGTNDLTITSLAGSGSGTCTAYWYPWYETIE